MLWHIELKFCIWLCFKVLQIKFECRQFASIFVGVMPLLELRILEMHSFPPFVLHPLTYWAESLHITFECHQFPSLFAGVMLLFNFKLLQICSFPHFSPTCFDILSSNFVYDFVLMYHRASLSVVILLQFLLELCLFVNLEYSKYTVFRTFLLHALTYWAAILHMTLF